MQPNPKPRRGSAKRAKAARQRREANVKRSVRADVDERDGYCLILRTGDVAFLGSCWGPSEWAHVGKHRRCHTRGMTAERRHTTRGSCKMCRKHHRAYDAHEFDIQPVLEELGMDGPVVIEQRASRSVA